MVDAGDPETGPEGGGPGRVKICGLCRRADVLQAEAAGADLLGVIASDGFDRSTPSAGLAELVEGVRATRVAVLVDETVEEATRRGRLLGAGVLQLHGSEPPELAAELRGAGPWSVWKALRIGTLAELEAGVASYVGSVDGLLVEGRREGVQGGGGAGVDPAWADAVRAAVPSTVRFVLAGGLTDATVYSAVARFRPDTVDVSSGVEASLCRKDPSAVTRFVREARRAFGSRSEPPISSIPE